MSVGAGWGRTHGVRATPLAVVVSVVALGATACGIVGEPKFTEGDCVKVDPDLLDSDIEEADCSDAIGTFDSTKRIYRVDSVIDGTEGECPPLQGFFPVQFTDFEDDVIYCLVQEDGS